MPSLVTSRSLRPGGLTVRFILAAAGVYATALATMYFSNRLMADRAAKPAQEAMFPAVFWVTSALLLAGSLSLQQGWASVRRERQREFRRWLLVALVLGTLFVGLQGAGLRRLASHQIPEEVQTGSNAFLTVLAALHALHFSLALLVLVWVTVSALAGRYDHEYYWGVTVCNWFWHFLGIVWLVILMVFLIAAR